MVKNESYYFAKEIQVIIDAQFGREMPMAKKNQQEWYKKFHEGTFLVQGWKSRMKEILKGLSPPDKGEIQELLENLGKKIGMEWARENEVRKIDTPQLQQWGQALRKAKQKGPEALAERIRQLNKEVDQKLSG